MSVFSSRIELKNQKQNNPSNFSPYEKFIYALGSKESKRQYPKRLQIFLDHINIKSPSIEENCNLFYNLVENDGGKDRLENELLKFFTMQNQRAERNEISTETIKNYFKPIKLFCEMNRIIINWKMIPNEIYQYLKKIDINNIDKINNLSDKIKFYDKPYLRLSEPKIIQDDKDSALVQLKIDRYNVMEIPIENTEIRNSFLQSIKNNFAMMIDYYAIDWDYDKMLFKSQQQNFAGFGKNRKIINTVFQNRLIKGKKYKIVVRVVDVFGNDSEAITQVNLIRK